MLPSGEIRDVTDTPYDLRRGAVLQTMFPELAKKPYALTGYDQNYVLSKAPHEMALAATVFAAKSGILMKLFTTQPGLQFYTGDHFREPFSPKAGLCLEAQGFPDAPNYAGFPSALLRPGETYWQRTLYAFERVAGY